jgi:hypothetical protein
VEGGWLAEVLESQCPQCSIYFIFLILFVFTDGGRGWAGKSSGELERTRVLQVFVPNVFSMCSSGWQKFSRVSASSTYILCKAVKRYLYTGSFRICACVSALVHMYCVKQYKGTFQYIYTDI